MHVKTIVVYIRLTTDLLRLTEHGVTVGEARHRDIVELLQNTQIAKHSNVPW